MSKKVSHIISAFVLVLALGMGNMGFAKGGDGGFEAVALPTADLLPSNSSFLMDDVGSDELFTSFEVYPNPSSGRFTLEFKTETDQQVSFAIYNLLGSKIYTRDVKNYDGAFKGAFDLSSYPSGYYFLQVRIGKDIYQHKLVLSK